MKSAPALLASLALASSLSLQASPASTTLLYASHSPAAARHLTLHRDGQRLLISDDVRHDVVASAPADTTRRVVIRGADGPHDDILTVDLSNAITLPDGIDYDGGTGGWDALAITGRPLQKERVTQLTPHDGTLDLDGLLVRYTNLEPVTDTIPAASLTVVGTVGADTVTVSDGPGAGEATISSPTFESYTFSNKTNVVFDGLGGGDVVTLNNPNTATGLSTFIIQNVATVDETAAFRYPALGISATGAVDLPDDQNDVDNVEIVTINGSITYHDLNTVTVGGVSPTLTGMRVIDHGDITLMTNRVVTVADGSVTLSDTDGPDIVHAGDNGGDITLRTAGIASSVIVPVNNAALIAPAGSVTVTTQNNLLLGTAGANFKNDIRASNSVTIGANQITLSGLTRVAGDDFGHHTGLGTLALAGSDFLLSNITGTGATIGGSGQTGLISTGGSVRLLTGGPAAVFSNNDSVNVIAQRLIVDPTSGITAPASTIVMSSMVPFDLGSPTDTAAALELSQSEIERITTPALDLRAGPGQTLTVTQPITFAGSLTLRTFTTFSATGSGSLSAPTLTFAGTSIAGGTTWTIDGAGITVSPGATIPYSGVTTLNAVGSSNAIGDTFNVTPAATTTFNIDGQNPTPPTLPGDTLNVNVAGTTAPALTLTTAGSGYSGSYTFADRAPVTFSHIETLGNTLGPKADLGITKSDGATMAIPGNNITYTIVASNAGPVAVAGATVVDTFPASLSDVAWTCTASPGSACNGGGTGGLNQLVDLAVNGTATFIVTATIDPAAAGTLSNSVAITPPAGTTDPNPANDTATDSDTLIVTADLAVSKTTLQPTYTRGSTITYSIVVTNAGPSNAADLVLTDPLPVNTTFASLTAPAGFSCTTPAVGTGGTIACTAATLPVGSSSFALVLNVTPSATGNIANTATVTATSFDPTPGNNASTATLAPNVTVTVPTLSELMLLLLAMSLAIIATVTEAKR